jgi:hypothetical protein
MIVFNDDKYEYWKLYIGLAWEYKSVPFTPELFSVLDSRFYQLLQILKNIDGNWKSIYNLNWLPVTLDDARVFTYIFNEFAAESELLFFVDLNGDDIRIRAI